MDYRQLKAIEQANKIKWLQVNPNLVDVSGIYILTRKDHLGIKYCYVGQSVHILTRLAEHLKGYKWIDISLKKYGLYNKETNPYGWDVTYEYFTPYVLDEKEREFILKYAMDGYQLRNITSGGQDDGKENIYEYRQPKTYHEGIEQGRINEKKKVKGFIKYIELKPKNENKITKRKYQEFIEYLGD